MFARFRASLGFRAQLRPYYGREPAAARRTRTNLFSSPKRLIMLTGVRQNQENPNQVSEGGTPTPSKS